MRTATRLVWVLLLMVAVGCGSSESGGGGDGDGDGDNNGDADGGSGADGIPNPPPFENCAGADASDDQFDGVVVCFDGDGGITDPDSGPLAVFEHEFVDFNGTQAVHIRLTLNPNFVDNTYGQNAVNWMGVGHSFNSLVGSDHAQILILDSTGQVTFDVKIDYIEADSSASCGFASGGVSGGDGEVLVGDESAILHWTTSLQQNLNDRGYCLTDDSPVTDENCTPDPNYPDWDFRVTYEIWIALSAFDPNSFGSAHMDFVHASPAKTDNDTITVEPVECPEDLCTNPDGCDNGPGGSCQDVGDCAADEFCYEGDCLPIVL